MTGAYPSGLLRRAYELTVHVTGHLAMVVLVGWALCLVILLQTAAGALRLIRSVLYDHQRGPREDSNG